MRSYAFVLILSVAGCLQLRDKNKDVEEHGTVSITCTYDPGYHDYIKYWCKGYYRSSCSIVQSTDRQSTGHVTITDNHATEELIISISSAKQDDAGWYWCGIERAYILDIMDYMHLTVSEAHVATLKEINHEPAKIILPLVVSLVVILLAVATVLIVKRRKRQKRESDRNPDRAQQISNVPEKFTTLPLYPEEDGIMYTSVVHHPSKLATPRHAREEKQTSTFLSPMSIQQFYTNRPSSSTPLTPPLLNC